MRRLISLDVVDTDAFLDMSQGSQLLYFHLNTRADDDGFIASPKKIMRMLGVQQNDMDVLVSNKFIISFNKGICVIKHWRINNSIRRDRYNETKYIEEKSMLFIRENGAYTMTQDDRSLPVPECFFVAETLFINNVATTRKPLGNQTHTQVKLSKVKLSKVKERRFKKPSLEEIKKAFKEKEHEHLSEQFYNHYEANGWKIGKNSMKNWKAAVAQWVAREKPTIKKTALSDKYAKYGKKM